VQVDQSTAFVAAVVDGEWRRAVTELGRAAERAAPEEVLVWWVARAAAEAGLRWERNQMSVDETHRSAAIVDACVDLLVTWCPPAPATRSIVLATAPHDWHGLPAHMAAAALRWRGWRCDVLGAMTKPARLDERLATSRPAAVGVSCSRPVHLPAVRTLVEAAHDRGVPVLVGGRAVTVRRARAVGADATAATFEEAAGVLDQWAQLPPPLSQPGPEPREAFELEAIEDRLVEITVTNMWEAYGPSMSRRNSARARDAVRGVLRATVAALRLNDDSVLTEELAWMDSLIEARMDVPANARQLFADVFTMTVPADFVDTRALLERAL